MYIIYTRCDNSGSVNGYGSNSESDVAVAVGLTAGGEIVNDYDSGSGVTTVTRVRQTHDLTRVVAHSLTHLRSMITARGVLTSRPLICPLRNN